MATEQIDKCECCERPATTTDDEMVPLCEECYEKGCNVVETHCESEQPGEQGQTAPPQDTRCDSEGCPEPVAYEQMAAEPQHAWWCEVHAHEMSQRWYSVFSGAMQYRRISDGELFAVTPPPSQPAPAASGQATAATETPDASGGDRLWWKSAAKLATENADFYRERAERAEAALARIKEAAGKVCEQYEICEHPACESTYAAWAIADEYLSGVRSAASPAATDREKE